MKNVYRQEEEEPAEAAEAAGEDDTNTISSQSPNKAWKNYIQISDTSSINRDTVHLNKFIQGNGILRGGD